MVVNTKNGVIIEGVISRDPAVHEVGSSRVLSISVRVKSTKKEDGSWESQYVSAEVWGDVDRLNGRLLKGDRIQAAGHEIRTRTGNDGKTYYSINADAIYPDARVVLRWLGSPAMAAPTVEKASAPISLPGDFISDDGDLPF